MLAYFMRRVRSAELAADLTAETFAHALASRTRFRRRGPAAAWLFGIARNVLAKSLRRGQVEDRGRRRLGMTELVLDDESVRLIKAMSSESVVDEALAALPPDQRDAVRARVLDEDSYQEIAQRMRCSTGVVRQRVSRGLARLRAHLEESA
jgi:RNA polymerase sigma factor (sigma-70 family)